VEIQTAVNQKPKFWTTGAQVSLVFSLIVGYLWGVGQFPIALSLVEWGYSRTSIFYVICSPALIGSQIGGVSMEGWAGIWTVMVVMPAIAIALTSAISLAISYLIWINKVRLLRNNT
jgi:hypothetical protein